jgi:zinc protease
MQVRARILCFLVLVFLAWPPVAAASEVRSWLLDDSTTLVLVEDHRAPLVQVVVEFPVGSWSPWSRSNHAPEAFEIQLYDSDARLRTRADELAADLGVSLGARHAAVDAACLRDDLEQVLELIGQLLRNEEFDGHELKRWKQGSTLEWKSSQKVPQFVLAQTVARTLFTAGDPRRLPYEKPQALSTSAGRLVAARDTIVRLPGRVIGFAGALDEQTARRLASALLPTALDELPEGIEPDLQPLVQLDERPVEQTQSLGRINQAFFHFGRDSLTYEDPRYPAFLIADHVLGGHFHSRLYEALRHEGGETYSAYTVGQGGTEREAYGMQTFTRAENAENTEAKLRSVLQRFHAEGISAEEFQAASGFLVGRLPFARQSPGQILRRYLWERRHGLPAGFHDDLVRRATQVPLAEINTFIRAFYDPELFQMIRVQPD